MSLWIQGQKSMSSNPLLLVANTSINPFLPLGYVLAAWKDCSSHGGGVLIMCKSHLLVDVIECTEYYVRGACEIVAVNFQDTAILCVYHQPGDTDLTI